MTGDALTPCKDCEVRHIGCHAACRVYAEWRTEHLKRRAEIDAKRGHELTMDKYHREIARKISIRKNGKKKRRRK